MVKRKRDFSRRLSQPLGPFKTLRDVCDFIVQAKKAGYEIGQPWEHIALMAKQAADGGDMQDVEIPLMMMLSMAGMLRR